MEQLQPNILVEMTDEELKELHNELTIIANRLEVLILPKWSNAFEISNKFHELGEVVEMHCLSEQWFSVHTRVDGAVVIVMMPEICQASHNVFV
jgi:hypothetical protein